jgi:Lrp/AsnC family transcriptional regulator, regulator for asnA, asnC and gidA
MKPPSPAENRLTQFDLQLVAALQHDARRPNTEIARELRVAESTVRRRIDWLIREGYIEISALTDPLKIGFPVWVVVEIQVDLPQIETVTDALTRLPEVFFIGVTTGAFDIFFTAVFRSNDELYHFISRELAKIPGIRHTATSSILRLAKRTFAYGVPGLDHENRAAGGRRPPRRRRQR